MKKFKIAKQLQLAIFYTRILRSPNTHKDYAEVVIKKPADKHEARKLHASVYISRGFIDSWEVTENGVIHDKYDPHHTNARYFSVKKRNKKDSHNHSIVATARQIYAHKNANYSYFPMVKSAKLSKQGLALIKQYPIDKIVEISALVKKKDESPYATMLLYRLMWQYSYKYGDRLWLMAVDVHLYHRLAYLFGSALITVGEKTAYKGGDIIPVIMDIKKSIELVRTESKTLKVHQRRLKQNLLRFFMYGIENNESKNK